MNIAFNYNSIQERLMNGQSMEQISKFNVGVARATAICLTRCGLMGSIKDPRVANARLKDQTLMPTEEETQNCLRRLR
jgi:hypothetical protein